MKQQARRVARRLPLVALYERRLTDYQREVQGLRAKVDNLAAAAPHALAEFVPPGHFYSAIPGRDDLRRLYDRSAQQNPLVIPGVELRMDRQLDLLDQLAPLLPDMPFGDRLADGLRYGFDNPAYAHADGMFLHLMLRLIQPSSVIEVGSGHSSMCTLDTVERFLPRTHCTFIDPYDELLRSLLQDRDTDRAEIITSRVQDVAVQRFAKLRDGDLLFIDSTHVSKLGSDVNHLFFEVLPSLSPGVFVHIHDIFPGFEYPWDWLEQGRVWQEAYLLRAFLQFNDAFDVVLWPSLLAATHPDRLFSRFPIAARNPGGAIYLRRRGGSTRPGFAVLAENVEPPRDPRIPRTTSHTD